MTRILNQAIKFKNTFMDQTTGVKLFLLEHDRGYLRSKVIAQSEC
jgi:hypothetical protein